MLTNTTERVVFFCLYLTDQKVFPRMSTSLICTQASIFVWDQSQSHRESQWHAESGTVGADEGSGNQISYVWTWHKHQLIFGSSSTEKHCRYRTIQRTWFYASFYLLIIFPQLWVTTVSFPQSSLPLTDLLEWGFPGCSASILLGKPFQSKWKRQ